MKLTLDCRRIRWANRTCDEAITLRSWLSSSADINGDNDALSIDLPNYIGQFGEVGQVVASQENRSTWRTLPVVSSYRDPVVVMHALSFEGGSPAHLRARTATSGFEWRIEEWDYLGNGAHEEEANPFLVVERGRHELDDGALVEAGSDSVGTGWVKVEFSEPFDAAPVLLTGVMSAYDSAAVTAQARDLTETGFWLRLREEENADGTHAPEVVGWVAIEPTNGLNGGRAYLAGRTPNNVTDQLSKLEFPEFMRRTPIFLANTHTQNEGDPGGVRYDALNRNGVHVFIEEERSRDSETSHVAEEVSYLAWSSVGPIFGSPLRFDTMTFDFENWFAPADGNQLSREEELHAVRVLDGVTFDLHLSVNVVPQDWMPGSPFTTDVLCLGYGSIQFPRPVTRLSYVAGSRYTTRVTYANNTSDRTLAVFTASYDTVQTIRIDSRGRPFDSMSFTRRGRGKVCIDDLRVEYTAQ